MFKEALCLYVYLKSQAQVYWLAQERVLVKKNTAIKEKGERETI
jgi:hypothetical protein